MRAWDTGTTSDGHVFVAGGFFVHLGVSTPCVRVARRATEFILVGVVRTHLI